jgi:hypothetical protein
MSEGASKTRTDPLSRVGSWHRSLDPLGRQRASVAIGLGLLLVTCLAWSKWSSPPRWGETGAPHEQSQLPGGGDGHARDLTAAHPAQCQPWDTAATNAGHVGLLVALMLMTSWWWLRWAYVPALEDPPRIGRPISKLSLVFLVAALILATCLRVPLMGAASPAASLLAGLAAIALLWRLLHWFGYRCAALFAGFFAAVHPAFIGADVQAGGDSLSVFFELLATASIYLALRTLKWRWWVLYAASTALCLYAAPLAIHFAIGTNLCLVIYLLRRIWRARTRAAAWPQLVRLCVANLMVAAALLLVAGPATDQAGTGPSAGVSQVCPGGGQVFADWQHIATGISPPGLEKWWGSAPAKDRRIARYLSGDYLRGNPGLALLTLILTPTILAFGIFKVLRGNRFARPLVLGGLIAPALAYAHCRHPSTPFPRVSDVSFALPVFVLLFSIGITSLAALPKNKALRPYIIFTTGAAYLIVFSILTNR